MHKLFSILGFALLFVALSSCSVDANMIVAQDGSIAVSTKTNLNPVFSSYLTDLLGVKAGTSLVDAGKLTERLSKEKGIKMQRIDNTKADHVQLDVQIASPNQVLSNHSAEVRKLISLKTDSGVRTLSFTFNRQIIETLTGIVTSEGGDQMAYLLPQKPGLTSKEYQASLDWAMEEYGSKPEREAMFSSAVVTINLQLPAAIISSNGFTIIDKARGRAQLKLNLLDLMTNRGDKVYALRY